MKNFVKFYDSILNSNKSSFVTVAISWLHIIRPNSPGYLDNVNPLIKLKFLSFKNLYNIAKYILIYFLYRFKKLKYSNNKSPLKKKCDVLLISHCLNKKMINKTDDFYLGNLEKILQRKKLKVQKIFINHTNHCSEFLNLQNKKKNHYVLEKYLGIIQELKIFSIQFKEFLRLYFIKLLNKRDKKLLKNIYISVFDKQTTFALRTRILIGNYLQKTNPTNIIFTYEGYAWERLLINTSKEFNTKIKLIGYQHPLVTKKNYAMLRNIKGKFNPDILWAPGNRSYNILRQSKKIKNIKIFKVGYLKKVQKYQKNNKIKPNCLVVPRASYPEIIKLFNFSIKCALEYKGIKFTLRLHPLVKLDKIIKKINYNIKSLPRNVIISKSSLTKDIKNSSFVLYTDSASVIEASKGGNIPIYLNSDKKNNNDLLTDYNKSRLCVKNSSELIKIITKYKIDKLLNIKRNAEKIFVDIYGKLNLPLIYKSLGSEISIKN
tara:strand:+ start:207 stop:1673 length:1467 start_codon:yes stop_codon:yes gene_type:complete